MPEVRSVRIGKYMEIEIEGKTAGWNSRLHQLCGDLLSNPVIEEYEWQRTDVGHQESEISSGKRNAQRRTSNVQHSIGKGGEQEEGYFMKALRYYFFCVVFPPLAVLITGRIKFISII